MACFFTLPEYKAPECIVLFCFLPPPSDRYSFINILHTHYIFIPLFWYFIYYLFLSLGTGQFHTIWPAFWFQVFFFFFWFFWVSFWGIFEPAGYVLTTIFYIHFVSHYFCHHYNQFCHSSSFQQYTIFEKKKKCSTMAQRWCLTIWVWGLGFRIWGLGFRV